MIRYILYFRDELQEYANWHPNTLKYIKRLHFSTVASPAPAGITYISIRHILFFLHELQKLSKWHPITMTYIKKFHYWTVTSPSTARITHFDPVHTIFLSFTLVETKILASETPNPILFRIPNIFLFYFLKPLPHPPPPIRMESGAAASTTGSALTGSRLVARGTMARSRSSAHRAEPSPVERLLHACNRTIGSI